MNYFTKDLAERAVKTLVQGVISVFGVEAVTDETNMALVAGTMAVLSIISSILSKFFGAKDNASLVDAVPGM